MNIVFVCGAGIVSGKEKQTLDTMTGLLKRGHQVFCIMSFWGSVEFERSLEAGNIPSTRLRIGFISKSLSLRAIKMTLHQLIYVPSLWWKYKRLLRKIRPDIVVQTNFHHVFLLYPVLGKYVQVFYVHDFFSPTRFFVRLFTLFRKRVHMFVAVSRFIAQSLKALGVPDEQIALVYNGIVPPEKMLPESGGSLRIGIVGQIGEWKGHHVLLQSIVALIRENHDIEVHIIGDGIKSYIGRLKEFVRAEGIGERVIFRGRVSPITEIYKSLGIVCVPSLKAESFGLTALEPGFFSIPVVCTDVGALPEIVLDKKTGLVVPSDDAPALTQALRFLIENPEARNRMGQAAFSHVNERFTTNKSIQALEEVFRKVMEVKR